MQWFVSQCLKERRQTSKVCLETCLLQLCLKPESLSGELKMPCENGLPLRNSKKRKSPGVIGRRVLYLPIKAFSQPWEKEKKVHRNIHTCMSVSCRHKGFDRIKWTIVNVYHGSIWSVVSAGCPSLHCLFAYVSWISWTGSGLFTLPCRQRMFPSSQHSMSFKTDWLPWGNTSVIQAEMIQWKSHSRGFLNWNKLPYF